MDFLSAASPCSALAGASGALAAPVAGRLADRGWSHPCTGVAITLVAFAFAMALTGACGSLLASVVACAMLDVGVRANLVFGQRAIYALNAEHRSRLNGLYMARLFVGGAAGSAVASVLFAHGGWPLVCSAGVVVPLAALTLFATERCEGISK